MRYSLIELNMVMLIHITSDMSVFGIVMLEDINLVTVTSDALIEYVGLSLEGFDNFHVVTALSSLLLQGFRII